MSKLTILEFDVSGLKSASYAALNVTGPRPPAIIGCNSRADDQNLKIRTFYESWIEMQFIDISVASVARMRRTKKMGKMIEWHIPWAANGETAYANRETLDEGNSCENREKMSEFVSIQR